MKAIYISSMGHFHPENKIGNDFFDSLEIGSDAKWVEERTGIKSRRSVLSAEDLKNLRYERTTLESLRAQKAYESIAEMSEKAWLSLQEKNPKNIPQPEALICGTSIPDYNIPANGCTIASQLDWSCPAFDVNSACSSFVVNLHVARSLISSEQYKSIGIFNPERYSLAINYQDKGSAVLFGDGCACAVISEEKASGSLMVLDTLIESDPANHQKVKIPAGGYFSQQGSAVQKFAITKTIQATKKILERNGVAPQDLAYFAGHQANLRMVESAAKKLGIPPERHLYNVHQYGNQGAAGAPSVISMNWDRFSQGELIAISVVGSGLTWGACLLQVV